MPTLLSSLNNNIVVQNWYPSVTYSMYDVTAGINQGGSFAGPPYYSTIDNNVGHNPSGRYIAAISNYSRTRDKATINITYSGTASGFARGSLYAITGLPDAAMNATGMILNAYPNGSANGLTLEFINPGPETSTSSTSLGAVNYAEPAWTTGFFWTPTYSSQLDLSQSIINVQFEPTYSQRSPQGLATNVLTWSLVFNDRTDTEVKGMLCYIQQLGGIYGTQLMIPPHRLFNNPYLLYTLNKPKMNTKSHGLSDITLTAQQVFD